MFTIFMNLVLSTILLMSFWIKTTTSVEYGYKGDNGPLTWQGSCNGGTKKQSPVDLTEEAGATPENWEIEFSDGYCTEVNGLITMNTGHGVEVKREEIGLSTTIFMNGSAFGTSTYHFAQLHFHWGSTDGVGSEHKIAGKQYSLEVHLVHRKIDNGVPARMMLEDDLAVLGILFEVDTSEQDNPAFTHILETFKCINNSLKVNMPYLFKSINLIDLFPKELSVFRYMGSLTTPDCNEIVLWTVFKTPAKISTKQLNMLRQVQAKADGTHPAEKLSNNFRPTQPLNGRTIKTAVLKVMGKCAANF